MVLIVLIMLFLRDLLRGEFLQKQPVCLWDWRGQWLSGSQGQVLLHLPQVQPLLLCVATSILLTHSLPYHPFPPPLPSLSLSLLPSPPLSRRLLLCRVTLGKPVEHITAIKIAHAPPGHHSVIGRPSAGGLNYPEYVIYRGEQVIPRSSSSATIRELQLECRQEVNVLNCCLFGLIPVMHKSTYVGEINNLSPCRLIQNSSSRTVSGTLPAESQSDASCIALFLHHFRLSFQFSVYLHAHAAPIQPIQTLNKTTHVLFIILL